MSAGSERRHRLRAGRETRLQLVRRIGDAYGLVLALILVTFVIMMTLPPTGWGGRVAAVAAAGLTGVIALTSSGVSEARTRLVISVAAAAVAAAVIAQAIDSRPLVGVAFAADVIVLAWAAATVLRRVLLARTVDFRTILGAISVFTLLGLLFGFAFYAFGRWRGSDFFVGVAHPQSSDYLFFSYTTLTTTGYGNLVPTGQLGQSLAVLEMLFGQIFLVTLVARLVSLWRPGSRISSENNPDPT